MMPATAVAVSNQGSATPAVASVEDLTAGLAAGDEEAFREFHRRYFDRLHRLALVLSRGDATAAADTVQDTFCRVARHARRFEDEAVFWCWLTVLARSAAREAGRKQRRYWALLGDYARRWFPPAPPAAPVHEPNLDALVDACLDELGRDDRALIEGKYLARLSVRELAARTQLTAKAVESRLGRLRQQLRERLIEKLRED
jgi:RNA polymerase sigma-70 factor (ECF subfamily)